jgi:hypothetical protein
LQAIAGKALRNAMILWAIVARAAVEDLAGCRDLAESHCAVISLIMGMILSEPPGPHAAA